MHKTTSASFGSLAPSHGTELAMRDGVGLRTLEIRGQSAVRRALNVNVVDCLISYWRSSNLLIQNFYNNYYYCVIIIIVYTYIIVL